MIYKVEDFYKKQKSSLKLQLLSDKKGLKKRIKKLQVHRPGLSLMGYVQNYDSSKILIMGENEIEFLKDLDPKKRLLRLEKILTKKTPAVIVSKKMMPLKELKMVCEKNSIALFRSDMETDMLIGKIIVFLNDEILQTTIIPATLVEVFSMGILIQGESSIGKSEIALGFIERGHKLISDDVVKIIKKDENILIGTSPEITKNLIEIRNIGIVNIAHLYGMVCIKERVTIDIVVELKNSDSNHFNDRVGSENKFVDILGVKIPFYLIFVNPIRDLILLIETLVLNQRLKLSGFDSFKEFNKKLLKKIADKESK